MLLNCLGFFLEPLEGSWTRKALCKSCKIIPTRFSFRFYPGLDDVRALTEMALSSSQVIAVSRHRAGLLVVFSIFTHDATSASLLLHFPLFPFLLLRIRVVSPPLFFLLLDCFPNSFKVSAFGQGPRLCLVRSSAVRPG